MKFPGKRKSKHYFPVSARDPLLQQIQPENEPSAAWVVGIDQTLSLEHGSRAHDDAPDADEGAIYILQKQGRLEAFVPRIGERQKPRNTW